jgi:ACR3 family arsenite efflux pump ArsB
MKWFDVIRRVVIFLLGAFCFLKGVLSPENTIPELIIGMIMVGVLPVDDFFIWNPRARRRSNEVDEKG